MSRGEVQVPQTDGRVNDPVASGLLHEILEQEKATDEKLTKLSYNTNENAEKRAA